MGTFISVRESLSSLLVDLQQPPAPPPPCATTRKPLPWSLTMAPVWSSAASPEMTLPAPSSPPSSAVPVMSPSWSAWATRTPTSVTRPVQERYPLLEVPHRARHRHLLGRHGEGLAPHLQQRVENLPRRVSSSPLRGSPQPQEQQGEARPDRLRDLQRPRHLRVHPGCALPVRLWSYHRYGPRHRRWCLSRRPHLRGLRPPPRHLASRLGRTRLDRLPHEDHVRARLLHGHHRRAGDGHRRLLLFHREVLRVARWTDRDRRQRAFPLPRVHVPPLFLGYGGRRHPRGLLQRHHEVRHRHP